MFPPLSENNVVLDAFSSACYESHQYPEYNFIILFHYEKNTAPQVNVPAKPIEFFFYVVMN